MKTSYLLTASLAFCFLTACEPAGKAGRNAPPGSENGEQETGAVAQGNEAAPKETVAPTPANSMVMLHVASQGYDYRQPWNKKKTSYSMGFAVYLGDGQFLTMAGVVVDSNFLELLSPDGSRTVMGKIKMADYETNLAILEISDAGKEEFLKDLVPVKLADAPSLGEAVEIWQFNDEGLPIISQGQLESTQVNVPMTSDVSFVLYQIRSSVNPVTGGASMPVMIGGKLAGMSLSYESSEQSMLSLTTPIIRGFIERAMADGPYQGTPVFGIQSSDLMDPVFKKYLRIPEDCNGLYVLDVSPGSSAELAGIKAGDVLESVNGMKIDGRGIVQDEKLGPVSCSMFLHDLTRMGEEVETGVRRNGELHMIKVTMNRDALASAIIPGSFETGQPPYIVHGGLVFQPLSVSYLVELFENNPNKMPLEYIEVLEEKDAYRKEGRDEIILLSAVVPTPATHGYDVYGGSAIKTVNGTIPKNMKHLAELLDASGDQDVLVIETNKAPHFIYLSVKEAKAANDYIKRVAISKLRNI